MAIVVSSFVTCVFHSMHVEIRGQLEEVGFLSFYLVDSGNGTPKVSLGGKCLYPLNQLTS